MTRLLFLTCMISLWACSHAGVPPDHRVQYYGRETFRTINPIISEDYTDYVQNLAGEYTRCDAVGERRLGAYTLQGVSTPVRQRSVGVLMDYLPISGRSTQDQIDDAKKILDKWVAQDPYRKQIETAETYGCGIETFCDDGRQGYMVLGCAFVPACENDGCVSTATQPPVVMPKAKAFNPDQYNIAENMFGTAWDRSHFLENLSGIETACEMIGAANWGFEQTSAQARYRGFSVYGRFGYAPNQGRTEPPLEQILRDIKDEELANNVGNVVDLRMGCSVIPDCYSSRTGQRNQMFVVVSCLFSTDLPRIYDN